jgi:hypothetical protein
VKCINGGKKMWLVFLWFRQIKILMSPAEVGNFVESNIGAL